MESIVNYESDDGNLKLTNKSKSKDSLKKKQRYSSDDDTSDSSDSSYERSRKTQNEEDTKNAARRHSPSPSPSSRKSSHKGSQSSHKSHDNRSDRRRRSSSKDSDKYERKKRKDREDDRDDNKRYRRRSKDRESGSHEKDSGKSRQRERDRERDRSSERRKDRHDERKRYNRHDDDYRSNKRDEVSHRSSNSGDPGSSSSSSSNSSSAIRRAEALNRAIERRANEKVQQLQKLGIEIPAIMQKLKPPENHTSQIRPLMSISTGITGGILPLNTALPQTATAANDESKAESDNLSVNLSNFTSSVLTNAKYTEQMQKKKLIWGAKKAAPEVSTNNKWEAAKFSQDTDGKVASKFLRLMGMKNATPTAAAAPENDDTSVQKREQMFSSMEQQYEIARQVTHTMRGVGLGFGSQSRPC